MARLPRGASPTGYYHVMMRGNNKESIFTSDDQKRYFLSLLLRDESLEEIAAYCIMNNHVHILLQAEKSDLSAGFKRLNIQYAMKYNFLNNRVGHVFQDRFKSEIITNDVYLTQVIRYIHLNPVRANIVQTPAEYAWSSYHEYFNHLKLINKTQKEFVLSLFSNDLTSFRNFHYEEDFTEYLDTKEEIQQLRLNHAQVLISNFCEKNGFFNKEEILQEHKKFLIDMLLKNTNLTHRQIAGLLDVSSSLVHKVNSNGKP